MTRQNALQTLQAYVRTPNLIHHHLAVEAAMRAICKVYNAKTHKFVNEELWALTGLLHDADYELTRNTPERHTILLEEKIGSLVPKEVMNAIKAHHFKSTGFSPQKPMDWALYSCDELTGFIVMVALEQKNKKFNLITTDMILQKLQNTSFVRSVDRKQIMLCEEKLGIPLREFIAIVLFAMQSIAPSLGFEV